MKIVVAGTRGIPNIMGGVETHCEQLYPRLVRLGCEVVLIRRSCYIDDDLSEYKGVRLKNVFAPKNKTFEAIIHSLLSVFHAKKLKADVLHIHAIGPSLAVPLARLLGLKVVVTNHGPDYDRQKWGKIAKFFLKLGEKLGTKYANEVIVISNVIKKNLSEKYKRNSVHLILNGVISPDKILTTEYIEQLGLESRKYILAAGRFVPEKGFDLLIDAFSKIENKNFKLVLAGEADHQTSYSEDLKKKAIDAGVIMTGFISGNKLNEIFTHTGLFVLPSYHEGLPISLLEAMSYELNVLVSDIPANKEVNLSDESYFITGNVTSLSENLKLKLESGKTICSYDMSKYNWDIIAEQVLQVYYKTHSGK